MNTSPKDVSLEPRSGSQDLHLLKSSIKEVSLNPLSPVANIVTPASNDERKLPCGRTPSSLKRKIAEMEKEMAEARETILIFERDIAQDMPEDNANRMRKLLMFLRKKYDKYEQRRNQYQCRLMRQRSNE